MRRNLLTIMLAFLVVFGMNAQELFKAPEKKNDNSVSFKNVINKEIKANQAAYTGNASGGTYSSITLADGTLSQTGTLVTDPFPMAEEFADGVVYRVDANLGFYSVNPDDGTTTSLGTLTGYSGTPTGLAYDWSSSTMYVLVLDASNVPHLCTLDMGTYVLTEIGAGTGMLIAMDFADDGYLYGPAIDDENLYQIDPATGASTVIGSTGLGLNYGQDVSFDPVSGMLYTINCGDQYTYGTYDLSTGAFSQIADMGGNQHATFVVCNYPVDNGAPAAVSNFVATPDAGGALTVDLSWTNPSLDFEGNTLTELTSIDVYIDGSATAAYTNNSPTIGGADSYIATVASAGMHSFKVVGTNSVGEGMPTNVSVWVGEDVPAAPGNVVLAATDMNATVTWDASAAGVHGGYFSGSNLTYTVVRQPGDVTVSTDQTGLSFNETIANAGSYYYEVTASNASGTGETGTSNTLIIGDFLIYEIFGTQIPDTWTVTGDWYWEDGTGNSLDGTGYSYIDSDAPGSGVTVAGELLSPVFGCTGTVTLEFDQYYNYISDETATVDIWDGAAWQTVADFGNGGVDLGAWGAPDHQVIDISTYANNDCQIRFNYDDLGAWNWYWAVDNVTVTGTSTIGINDIASEGIKVFPNPSNGVFNINVDNNYNLEVFDITGRVINTRTLSGNTSIKLDNAGVYFLRFSNEKGSYTQKVIVQ